MMMKLPAKFHLVLSLLFGLGLQGKAEEAATLPHVPILPAKPQTVLSCLPPAPANWKVTESWGQNNYIIAAWQFTVACRKYLEVPPPPLPGQPPKVPGVTEITVKDTGYWVSANSIFLDPSGAGPNSERSTLDDYPMIRMTPTEEGGDQEIILWVKQRFIIYITASKQESDSDEKWARLIDFAKLQEISDDGPTKLPTLLTMSTFDELVPSRTQSHTVLLFRILPGTPGH